MQLHGQRLVEGWRLCLLCQQHHLRGSSHRDIRIHMILLKPGAVGVRVAAGPMMRFQHHLPLGGKVWKCLCVVQHCSQREAAARREVRACGKTEPVKTREAADLFTTSQHHSYIELHHAIEVRYAKTGVHSCFCMLECMRAIP